jgi:hypothetical protein
MGQISNPPVSGIFTPVLAFGGASVGMTGSFVGHYTLIGNRLFFNLTIILTAKGSSTGTALITGLPYPNLNSTNNRGAFSTVALSMASMTDLHARIGPNASGIDLSNFTGSTEVALTEANFTDTSFIIISGHYPVSA